MKKLLLLMLMVGGLFCLCACGANESEEGTAADAPVLPDVPVQSVPVQLGMVVDASVVNIRQQPSLEGRILDTALRGELFKVLQTTADGWCEVFYRGDTAYISKDFLYVEEVFSDDQILLGTITESVNVREDANPEATVLYTAEKNEQVLVTDGKRSDGWYEIDYNGISAFVSTECVALHMEVVEQVIE